MCVCSVVAIQTSSIMGQTSSVVLYLALLLLVTHHALLAAAQGPPAVSCNPASTSPIYRSFDGTCNNLDPAAYAWGKAGSFYIPGPEVGYRV